MRLFRRYRRPTFAELHTAIDRVEQAVQEQLAQENAVAQWKANRARQQPVEDWLSGTLIVGDLFPVIDPKKEQWKANRARQQMNRQKFESRS